MEPTHLLCRKQLHEEELRLVKADLVILGKFFELLPSGSDREKIFDSPLFRQVVLEVLRKAFSLAGVPSFFPLVCINIRVRLGSVSLVRLD